MENNLPNIRVQAQRYEAASTIYGPNTLHIYLHKYKQLTEALMKVGS